MDSTMSDMKPLAVDEMFPEGASYVDMEEAGSMSGVLMDVGNEKNVHADFYDDFDDLYDETDFEL